MRTFLLSALLSALALSATVHAADVTFKGRDDVGAFAAEFAAEESLDALKIQRLLEHADYKQSIIDAISRPAEKRLTWGEYRDIFLTSSRIKGGAAFIEEHAATLARAEATYGVPPHLIASVIGVETLYGKRKGSYRVLDALMTLAFEYPPRAKFFRSELKNFLLLVREEDQSITDPVGSYAGAMGYGQFIPSSYRHYAVDFDGDNHRDIWNNPVDAIGSVANYLSRHGWQSGGPVAYRVNAAPQALSVFAKALKPDHTLADLDRLGVARPAALPADTMVTPLALQGHAGMEYWLGLQNFYVITRYNHSHLYAMAVYQLSEAIAGRDSTVL